jgi:hypothetical protein
MALIHAGLSVDDAMFACLDRAYQARDVHLVFLTVDPKWDPHRAHAKFRALLGRCNFTREAIRPSA